MNLNIAIVRPLRDMFSALTESVNKVFDHSEYTTDHLECFGFVLRVFDRHVVFMGILFALCWCRGFISKRDDASRAVRAIGAHR